MATVMGAITWYLNQIRKDRPDPVINPAWPTVMVTLLSPQLLIIAPVLVRVQQCTLRDEFASAPGEAGIR
jgi:hypothetical protein